MTQILDQYLLPQQWGGRRQRGVNQPLILTDLMIDLAAKHITEDLWVCQLDVTKYFNNVDAEAVLPSMMKAGIPAELIQLLSSLYTNLSYHNKYHSGILGPAWRPGRGIPQGDPCAVLIANWYMMILIQHARVCDLDPGDLAVPQGEMGSHVFLDDVTLIANSHPQLQRKVTSLAAAMQRVGLTINAAKSGWISARNEGRDLHIAIDGVEIPRLEGVTLLGVDLAGQHDGNLTKASQRFQTCRERLERIPRLPVGEDVRAHLIAASALSPMAYMPIGAWVKLDKRWMRRIACVLKRCNPNQWVAETAMEILFFTMHAGHLLAYPWSRWYQLSKLITQAHQLASALITKLMDGMQLQQEPMSIVDTFYKISRDLDIQIQRDFIAVAGPNTIDLRQGARSWSEHLHAVRSFLRKTNAVRLEARRPLEFRGVGQGIDRAMTMMGIKALEKKGDHLLAAAARRWQCGGMRSRERFIRHTKRTAPVTCGTCNVVDDLYHILWTCGRWTRFRVWAMHPPDAPRCLCVNGIVPCGWQGDKQWLRIFLTHAPKLLCHYMQWVVNADDSCWTWPAGIPEQPLPAPRQRQLQPPPPEQIDWPRLVKRRLTTKQRPPLAFTAAAYQDVNGHKLRALGTPSKANKDRGVQVVLQCIHCHRRRTHARRTWFTLNGCPKNSDNDLDGGPCGKWRNALTPLLPAWSVAWRKGLPRLTCKACGWAFCPIRIRHLQPRVAAHLC